MQITIKANGLQELKERLETARSQVKSLIQDALKQEGDKMVSKLQDAAPRGINGGPPPKGDAPGTLANSIHATQNPGRLDASVEIRTNQPTKMKFVREGRGVVLPINKKALAWKGLPHPVMYSRPSHANDFVTPILDTVESELEIEMRKAIARLKTIMGGV